MSAKRHRHRFSPFGWRFGPYGRQDVHVHDCMDDDCDRALVGQGRDCDGKRESHHRETLTAGEETS